MAAISGGAVFPAMTGAVATHTGSFHYAMAIPTAGYFLSLIFPIYLNMYKRDSMDLHRATDLNIDASRAVNIKAVELENANGVGGDEKGASETIENA